MHADTTPPVAESHTRRDGSAMNYAYENIKAAILEGKYAPGTRLTEDELARNLKVSRTPVREALHLLESEMLVETVSRVGLIVPIATMVDLEEIFEVRWVVDGHAARLAAKWITKGELLALESTNERIVEAAAAADEVAIGRANLVFHRQILEAAHNRRLLRINRGVADMLSLVMQQTTLKGAEQRVFTEHRQILSALQAGDPDAAEAAAKKHVEAGLEFHRRHLAEAQPQH